jgi:hypothetical protein
MVTRSAGTSLLASAGTEKREIPRKGSGMAERRDEERVRIIQNEDDDRRREEKTRRAEQLRDAWRRNHPSESPEGSERGRPKKNLA